MRIKIARMPSFDGHTDSANVTAIRNEVHEMEWKPLPSNNEIERELYQAKGDLRQAIAAHTAMS